MNFEFKEAFVSSTTILVKTKSLSAFSILKTLFVFIFLLGAVLPAFAIRPSWAGRPDFNFGNAGKVMNRFNLSDSISDIALQPDGKIVTANSAFVNNNYDLGVSRYNPDGSVDTAFGSQGDTTTDLANSSDRATAIALQADGKILVGGYTGNAIFKPVVVRYTNDGDLDGTFGTGGIVVFQNVVGQFYAAVVQPDGKILLGGFTFDLSGSNQADFFLVRLLENGQLDKSFGTGGIVTTGFFTTPTPTPTPTPSVRTNVALAANGGVASASSESAGNYSPALANNGIRTWSNVGGWRDDTINVFPDFLQIDFNGSKTINQIDVYAVADDFLNPTEPTDADTFTLFGITDFDVQYWDGANWITVPNGSIRNNNKVITRVMFPAITTTRIRVLVLNGQGGYSRIVEVEAFTTDAPPTTTPPGVSTSDIIRDLALQPDGKIIAVGTNDLSAARGDFAIARYNADGQLDTSFDTDGKLTTDFSGEHDEARAIALQTDGRFVVGGFATIGAGRSSALVRYNSNGSLDTTFAAGGKLTTDISFYGFVDVAVLPNNKIIAGTTIEDDFALLRYNVNGTPDPTFDFDGIVQTSFLGQSVLNAILLQPDGKLVAGGDTYNPVTRITSNALARYNLSIAHADFDGDNRTDLSVFRPAESIWYLKQTRLGFASTQLGSATDIPVAADYDGDGKYDIANFSAGVWTVLQSLDGTMRTVQLGQAGDIPVPGDYDRDGSDDFAVFRDGNWRILGSTNNQIFEIDFGQAGDIPVPADYDHDGQIDVAVYRAGVWFLQKSTEGFAVIPFGIASDIPVIGDFDGDGRSDQTVFRTGIWYLNLSRDGFAAVQFGLEADIPVTGDFDGDDITDIAVYRNGFWYVLNSSTGFSAEKFGQAGDRPIPIARLQ